MAVNLFFHLEHSTQKVESLKKPVKAEHNQYTHQLVL